MNNFQRFSLRASLLAGLGLTILLNALTSCGPNEVDKKIREERAARAAAEEAVAMERKN
jgi:hypothetical protein